jgi:hypothetical protein
VLGIHDHTVRIWTASTISVPTEMAPMMTTVSPRCKPALRRQIFQRRFNGVLRIDEIKLHHERRDAPAQRQFVGGFSLSHSA